MESRDCEFKEEVVSPPKVGPEAVRADVDEILRGARGVFHPFSFSMERSLWRTLKLPRYELPLTQSDPLQLLSTLSLSTPSTPIPSTPNPASSFPFLPASGGPPTPSSTTPIDSESVKSQRKDLGRQRSVRTERRREKFAKVLRGRVEDGGGVEVGEYAWGSNCTAGVSPFGDMSHLVGVC